MRLKLNGLSICLLLFFPAYGACAEVIPSDHVSQKHRLSVTVADTATTLAGFYRSLPQFPLPVGPREPAGMSEVPERLLDSLPTYGLRTWAVALPDFIYEPFYGSSGSRNETEGLRFILCRYEREDGELIDVLCTYDRETMDFIEGFTLSDVREIDGGRNVLSTSSEIQEEYDVIVRTVYHGPGADGREVSILFQEKLLTPRAGGKMFWVGDENFRSTEYEEPEPNRFIVRTYFNRFDTRKQKWGKEVVEEHYYIVDGDSRLVEVEQEQEQGILFLPNTL